jgi:hypothetical protein
MYSKLPTNCFFLPTNFPLNELFRILDATHGGPALRAGRYPSVKYTNRTSHRSRITWRSRAPRGTIPIGQIRPSSRFS